MLGKKNIWCKLDLSPQNFHYDVLYPLYSAHNICSIVKCSVQKYTGHFHCHVRHIFQVSKYFRRAIKLFTWDYSYSCLHCLALILVELQNYLNDLKLKRKKLICSTVLYPTTVFLYLFTVTSRNQTCIFTMTDY